MTNSRSAVAAEGGACPAGSVGQANMFTGDEVAGFGPGAAFGGPVRAAPRIDFAAVRPFSWYLPVKFAAEWLAAAALLVLTAPLMLLLAVAVKATSPGPAFYAQTRLGLRGRRFRIFKLRTMVHQAEAGTGAVWAARDDVRITPLGRFLRNTHLDELPQLWNVLRGEMALIGPRPERPEIAVRVERRLADFRRRLAVRPGVTGLAQMLQPADDPADVELRGLRRKLALDLAYVRDLGPLMDLRVALSTPFYFLAAAADVLRRGFVRSYEAAAKPADADDESGECEAA